MPGKKTRLVAVLGATLLAVSVFAPTAWADDTSTDNATVSIVAGILEMTDVTVTDFGTITPNGTNQTVTTTPLDFTVTDARGGLGAGWNLTVGATQFQEGVCVLTVCTPTPLGANLPTGSLTALAPASATAVDAGNTSGAPSLPSPASFGLDGSTVKIVSAAAGNGLGDWDVAQGGDWSLVVPSTAEAADYFTTVTYTLSTGP